MRNYFLRRAGFPQINRPAPRLSHTKKKRALRGVMKRLIRKTEKGSIAKVRRRYPGTASLRDTSSEGSVSSGGGSRSRKLHLKLQKNSDGETNLASTIKENSRSGSANLGDGKKI